MSWVISLAVSACALFLVSNAESKIRKTRKESFRIGETMIGSIQRADEVAIGYAFSCVHEKHQD